MAEAPQVDLEQQTAGGETPPDDTREDETQTDEQMWDQVRQDRTQEFAPEKPAAPNPELVAESTQKLLEEIDKLREAVKQQGTEVKTVQQHVSRVNGLFGNMKQRVEQMVPAVNHVQATRAAEEKARREEAEQRRVALREKVVDLGMPELVEYIDTVAPKADDKPAVKPAAPVQDEVSADERLKIVDLQRQLSDEVPGWMRIRDSAEFKAWASQQPPEVHKIMSESHDVQESAGVFKAFLSHRAEAAKVAQVEKDRQARLRRGEMPTGRGTTSANADDAGDGWDRVARDRARERQSA
jgi:hypothetical protein